MSYTLYIGDLKNYIYDSALRHWLSFQIGPFKYRTEIADIWDEFTFSTVTTSYVTFNVTEMYDGYEPAFIEIQLWTDPSWERATETNDLDVPNEQILLQGKRNDSQSEHVKSEEEYRRESGSDKQYIDIGILLTICLIAICCNI